MIDHVQVSRDGKGEGWDLFEPKDRQKEKLSTGGPLPGLGIYDVVFFLASASALLASA